MSESQPLRDNPESSEDPAIQPRELFEILVRDHEPRLRGFVAALVSDPGGVDDVVQEAFLVAWRNLDRYDRSLPFGPWLRGIARRLCLAHYRKASDRRLAFVGLALVIAYPLISLMFRLPDNSRRPESHTIANGDDTALGRALGPESQAHPGQSGIVLLANGRDAFVARALLARQAERSIIPGSRPRRRRTSTAASIRPPSGWFWRGTTAAGRPCVGWERATDGTSRSTASPTRGGA